jgi:hypothetical protein
MIVNQGKKQGGAGILAMCGKTNLTADLRGRTRIILELSADGRRRNTQRKYFRCASQNLRFIRVNQRKSAVNVPYESFSPLPRISR